jgi:predicted CXXCH cytochrome family protein
MVHSMKRREKSKTGPVLLCLGLCLFISACSMFDHRPVALVLPSIPGAEYVGPETCSTSDCHETEHRYFQLNQHARVAIRISDEDAEAGQVEACETCHGPGSLHVENRGRKQGDILVNETETCLACHLNVKAKFMLQHHHPVREGRMSCTDCHSVHGSDVGTPARIWLHNGNEMCFRCHKEMRGPFVFEHDAVRDGCTSCHNPHGSINDKLLVAGQTTTCLRCHWESAFNTGTAGLGSHAHSSHAIGAGQDCIDCHAAVHGSNIWRSLRK